MLLPLGGGTKTLEDSAGNYAGEGGDYSASMMAMTLGAGVKGGWLAMFSEDWMGKIALGGAVKLFTQNIDGVSSTQAGFDAGALFQIKPRETRVGLTARNLGKDLPMEIRAGIQQVFMDGGLLADLDLAMGAGGMTGFAAGGEYAFGWGRNSLALRGGIFTPLDAAFLLAPSFGLGYAYRERGLTYILDYAFVSIGDLGATHRISLTAYFGAGEKAALGKATSEKPEEKNKEGQTKDGRPRETQPQEEKK
jgi:hypothetical protein